MQDSYVRSAVITKIYDADTITVNIDLGYRITTNVALRLSRINCPEMGTAEGKAAKAFLLTHLQVGSSILIKTFKDPTDKYGRWIAEIYKGEININDLLVKSGHAVYVNY